MLHPQFDALVELFELQRSVGIERIHELHQRSLDPTVNAEDAVRIHREIRAQVHQLCHAIEALDGIRHGDYGLCATCHLPIPVSELVTNPAQRRCSHCIELQSGDTKTTGQ